MQHGRFQRWIAGLTFFSYLLGLTVPTWATQALIQEEQLPPVLRRQADAQALGHPLQNQAPHTSHKLSLTIDHSQPDRPLFTLDYEGWGGANTDPKETHVLTEADLSSPNPIALDRALRLQFDRVLKPLHGAISGLGQFEVGPDGSFKLTRAYRQNLSPVTLDLTTPGKVFLEGFGFSNVSIQAPEIAFGEDFEAGRVTLEATDSEVAKPLLMIPEGETYRIRHLTVLKGRIENHGDLETSSLTLGAQALFQNQKAAHLKSLATLHLTGDGTLVNEGFLEAPTLLSSLKRIENTGLLKGDRLEVTDGHWINQATGILSLQKEAVLSLTRFFNDGHFEAPHLSLHIREDGVNHGSLQGDTVHLRSDRTFLNEGPQAALIGTKTLTFSGPGTVTNRSRTLQGASGFQIGILSQGALTFEDLGTLINEGDFLATAALQGRLQRLENKGRISGTSVHLRGLAQGLINQETGHFQSTKSFRIQALGALHNEGTMEALQGPFTLIAQHLHNKGTLQALGGLLTAETEHLTNTGAGKIGGHTVTLKSTQSLENEGGIQSEEGPLLLQSTKDFENKGTVAAKKASLTLQMPNVKNRGSLLTPQELRTQATTLTNEGVISIETLGQRPNLQHLLNEDGATFHQAGALGGPLQLMRFINKGAIEFLQALDLQIREMGENTGTFWVPRLTLTLESGKTFLNGDAQKNQAQLRVKETLTLKGRGTLFNQARTPRKEGSKDLTLQSGLFAEGGIRFENFGSFRNTGDAVTQQALGGTLDKLENEGFLQGKTITLTGLAQGMFNRTLGQILSEKEIQIQTPGALQNEGFLSAADGLLDVKAGTLTNKGTLETLKGKFQVEVGSGSNVGKILGQEGLLKSRTTLVNEGTAVALKGPLTLEGQQIANKGDLQTVSGPLSVTADQVTNAGAGKIVGHMVTLGSRSHALDNEGVIQSEEGSLLLQSTKDFENKGTVAAKKASLTLQMPNVKNRGTLLTPKELHADITTLTNDGFLSMGTLKMPNLKHLVNEQGAVFHHAGSLSGPLRLFMFHNKGTIEFLQALDLQILEKAQNKGTLKAPTLSVTAPHWNNDGGKLFGQNGTTLHLTKAFSNKDGVIGGNGITQVTWDPSIASVETLGTLQGEKLVLRGGNTMAFKNGTLIGTTSMDLLFPNQFTASSVLFKTPLLLLTTRAFNLDSFRDSQNSMGRFLFHKSRNLSWSLTQPFKTAGSFEIWEEGALSREDLLTKTAAANFEALAARFDLAAPSETTLSFLSILAAGSGVVLATPHGTLQVGTEGAQALARIETSGPFSFIGTLLDIQNGGLSSSGKMRLWFKDGHLGRTIKNRTPYPFTFPSGGNGTFFYTKEEGNGSFIYAKEGLNGFWGSAYAELFPIESLGPIDLRVQNRLHLCSSSLRTKGPLTLQIPDLHLNRKVGVYDGYCPEADNWYVKAFIPHERASEISSEGPLTLIGLQKGVSEGGQIHSTHPSSRTIPGIEKIAHQDLYEQVTVDAPRKPFPEYQAFMYRKTGDSLDDSLKKLHSIFSPVLGKIGIDPHFWGNPHFWNTLMPAIQKFFSQCPASHTNHVPLPEGYISFIPTQIVNKCVGTSSLSAVNLAQSAPVLDLRNLLVQAGTIDLTCDTLLLPDVSPAGSSALEPTRALLATVGSMGTPLAPTIATLHFEPFEPVQPLLNLARLTQLHVEEPENPTARFNLPAFLRDPEPILPPLTVISPEGLSLARDGVPRLLAPVLEREALRQALIKQFARPCIDPAMPVEVLYHRFLQEGHNALKTWQSQQGNNRALVRVGPQALPQLSLEKPALFYQEVTHEDGKPVYVPTIIWPRSYEALRPQAALSGDNVLLNAWSITGAVQAREQLAILSPDLKPLLMLEEPQNLAPALAALPAEQRRELFLQGTFKGKKTLVASLQNLRASSRVERQRTPTGFQDRLHRTAIEGDERLDVFAGGTYRDDSILAQSSQGNIHFQVGGHKESRALALQSLSETSGICADATEWTFHQKTTQTTPVPSTYRAKEALQERVAGHNLSEAPHIIAQSYDSQAGEDNILLPVTHEVQTQGETRTEDHGLFGSTTKVNTFASFTQKAQVATIQTEEQVYLRSDVGNITLTAPDIKASKLALEAPHGTVALPPAPNVQESAFQGSSTGPLATSQTLDVQQHVTHTYPQLPEETTINAPQVVLSVPETLQPFLPPQVIGTAVLALPVPAEPLPSVFERLALLAEPSASTSLHLVGASPQRILPTSPLTSRVLSPHRPFTTQEERALALLQNLILAEGSQLTFQFHQDQHHHHHEEHTSLNPRFCALMGVAATLATGGLLGPAALAQTSFITSLAGATGIPAATLSAAAMAGISTMGGQGLANLIGHEGDLGAVLEDLSSPSFLKSLAANMASAGLLNEVKLGRFGKALTFMDKPQTFLEHGQKALTQAVVQTGVHAALQGGSLENALETTLRTTVANTAGGIGANALHDLLPQIGFLPHKLGHGVLGGVIGGLLSQDPETGIKTGFISGLTAETLAEGVHGLGFSKELAGSIGEFSGPLTVFFTQGENGDILTASVISHNAIENNFLYEPLTRDGIEQEQEEQRRLREEVTDAMERLREAIQEERERPRLPDALGEQVAEATRSGLLTLYQNRDRFHQGEVSLQTVGSAFGAYTLDGVNATLSGIHHGLDTVTFGGFSQAMHGLDEGMHSAGALVRLSLRGLGANPSFSQDAGDAAYLLLSLGGPQKFKASSIPRALPDALEITTDKLLMGEYRTVKGHHVHAKKAFEGHVNYNPQKGFSMSNELMEMLDIKHQKLTGIQQKLFRELEISGRPNTMREHTRIAVESLVEAGIDQNLARSIVANSLDSLRKQGVKEPMNIPWAKQKK